MKRLPAIIIAMMTFFGIHAQQETANISGSWSGKLKMTPEISLKIVMNLDGDNVTLDSPDQGAYGIPGEIIFVSPDSLSITVPQINAAFTGSLNGNSLEGMFKQGGMQLPLILTSGVEKVNRPQTPQPPFPYSTQELKIATPDGIIAGTLTIPENSSSDTPLAVMVTGSGLQNRDEEIFEHKPFAVISDYLARNGIASFRYDDRGVGESTGDPENATTFDFANDAENAIRNLRQAGIFGKIGILGHSEGGTIAYILGAKPQTIDFIVSIAGPSIKGTQTIAYQNKEALLKVGIPELTALNFEKGMTNAFEYKINHPEDIEVTDELMDKLYPEWNSSAMSQQLAASVRQLLTTPAMEPWMAAFLSYDPAADMQKLDIPTLILYGEKDKQVPASLNADRARNLAPKALVKIFPELNHLMQHAKTGQAEEYNSIEETISPQVLEDISIFITQQK